MPLIVLIDESGDLGWSLDKPYGQGGSSQYLTIGYMVLPEALRHLPERLVREVYNKYQFQVGREKKATELKDAQKTFICQELVALVTQHREISIGAITVKKASVMSHIRADGNKLYNYMIRLAILDKILHRPKATFYRDERSIKVASGNSCIDYLQTVIWFDSNSETEVIDKPTKSHTSLNIMLVDWIVHIVWSRYEYNRLPHFIILSAVLNNRKLFF